MLNNFNTAFANRLRHYMRINNMTQRDIAVKMGVSEASVSNWIKGIKVPRADKIDKLCLLFHCNRSDLTDIPVIGHPKPLKSEQVTIVRAKERPRAMASPALVDATTKEIQLLLKTATPDQRKQILKIAEALLKN